MDLQPITSGRDNQKSYTGVDGIFQKAEQAFTSGFTATTIIGSPTDFRFIFITNSFSQQTELFAVEKKCFQEFIKVKKFLKDNKGQYIALKQHEILGIDSTFSELA